jgi:hypothetical protein
MITPVAQEDAVLAVKYQGEDPYGELWDAVHVLPPG